MLTDADLDRLMLCTQPARPPLDLPDLHDRADAPRLDAAGPTLGHNPYSETARASWWRRAFRRRTRP